MFELDELETQFRKFDKATSFMRASFSKVQVSITFWNEYFSVVVGINRKNNNQYVCKERIFIFFILFGLF